MLCDFDIDLSDRALNNVLDVFGNLITDICERNPREVILIGLHRGGRNGAEQQNGAQQNDAKLAHAFFQANFSSFFVQCYRIRPDSG